jgi:ubiquinone/menaquinone biosynthesis C-methylase UbiE
MQGITADTWSIMSLNLMHAVQEFFRVLQPGGYLLITAFHPDAIERGWRTNPTIAGIQYLLPNRPHTRTGYIEALTRTRFHILKVIDAIVGEVPDGYLSEAFRSANENKTLCLIVLAQRPS